MPIYIIIPRYSHNYSLFYQLLDSNLFTHCNTYAILREATNETYGPLVYLLSYKLSIYFYLHLYFSNLYYKILKIYLSYHIISIRSHFRNWPWRDWQPLYRVGCEVLICLCRYEVTRAWSPTGLIPWFSKTEGNTYAALLHRPFLFKVKPTQCSRGSSPQSHTPLIWLTVSFVLPNHKQFIRVNRMLYIAHAFIWFPFLLFLLIENG